MEAMNQEKGYVELLNAEIPGDTARIQELSKTYDVIDTYDEQLEELFSIRHPELIGTKSEKVQESVGEYYAVFPWRKVLVRIVGKEAYRELRTNRNRELLTSEEQRKFMSASIAFAGLNVG